MKASDLIKWKPLIEAVEQGKTLQYMSMATNAWEDIKSDADCYAFTNPIDRYRIKPEPSLRAWKPEEVPVGCQLRGPCWTKAVRSSVVSVNGDGVGVPLDDGNSRRMSFDELLSMEHSTDGGNTWKPCGIVEDAS